MRVTDALRFELYKNQLSTLKTSMDQLTTEVASGKKILVPADDPASFAKNIEITAQQSQNTQYAKNLNSLQTASSYYQTAVNTVSNVLTQVQQLAVQQASDTVDANSRSTAASQVNDIIQQLVAVGNTKVGNTYLFGGKNSSVPAYTLNTTTNAVTFNGTSAVTKVAVDSSTTVDGGFSGNTVFTGRVSGQSVDIFQTLQTFSNDLRTNNTTGIKAAIDNINACVDLTANSLSSIGTYAKNVSNLLTANSTADTTLTQTSAGLMDVDMAKAISDYSTLSTAYQAALYTMAKVESLNIMNYLPPA